MRVKLLPFYFFLIVLSLKLFAGTTGKISGIVTDKETGEGIPLANVYIEGTTLGAAADVDGNYTILNVPPGVYTVTASVIGYQKLSVTDVRVNVDFTTRLNFQLSSGSIDLPAVLVQGERNPLIRQDLTNPTVAITTETIQELPVDQLSDVIKLQAGVVVGNDGDLHIRGGYGNEIAYTLNGITLNDPYGNRSSLGLATNAVQEVSVSSGTFSAEYGNALSGVVNYVTKEGGNNYTFSVRSYVGDYLTSRDDLFDNIDEIDPLNRGRIEATIGGAVPLLPKVNFYVSGVYENFKGSLYGKKLYNTTDSYLTPESFKSTDPRLALYSANLRNSSGMYFFNPYDTLNTTGLPTGDGSTVAMNWSKSMNIQGNISYRPFELLKIKYEAVFNKSESKGYSFSFKYNPDGVGTNYSNGFIQSIDITHTLSDKVFYTLKASYGYNENKYYLFEDINDPGYLPSLYLRTITNTTFYAGGTDNTRTYRKTTTSGVKGDLVAQVFGNHEIKTGFEFRYHDLQYEGYDVEVGILNNDGSFDANITNDDLLYGNVTLARRIPTSPSLYTSYRYYPSEFTYYVLDKIELASSLVLNFGLRYEWFNPNAQYNPFLSADLKSLKAGSISTSNEKASIKQNISPRLSVSYPITDRGVIRFSYGHFYQNGSLGTLYRNPNFYVANVGSTPTFGNANVEPQKSVQYELGLQQQLTEDLKFDLTGFYKDVTNYIYTQTVYTTEGRQYYSLTNLAYANTRGITLSFIKRRSPGSLFYASLDYTFSLAEGNRTYPSEEIFFSEQSGKQTETYLVALDFDRRHVINATVGLTDPDNFTIGLIGNIQTGSPYTPELPSELSPILYLQNSAYQKIQWNVDLKMEKFFKIGNLSYSVFLQVENLFDVENEYAVYASSGRALSNVEQVIDAIEFNDIRKRINRGDPGLFGIDQVNNYYSQRPERVSRPREVRLGLSIIFN
ncbi:MAG: TonB-dependent receptor [Ignavibacteriales bacterium]|nr:MAG: TonB-dependent receptor [Ignavibacteriales bacterium]